MYVDYVDEVVKLIVKPKCIKSNYSLMCVYNGFIPAPLALTLIDRQIVETVVDS